MLVPIVLLREGPCPVLFVGEWRSMQYKSLSCSSARGPASCSLWVNGGAFGLWKIPPVTGVLSIYYCP